MNVRHDMYFPCHDLEEVAYGKVFMSPTSRGKLVCFTLPKQGRACLNNRIQYSYTRIGRVPCFHSALIYSYNNFQMLWSSLHAVL